MNSNIGRRSILGATCAVACCGATGFWLGLGRDQQSESAGAVRVVPGAYPTQPAVQLPVSRDAVPVHENPGDPLPFDHNIEAELSQSGARDKEESRSRMLERQQQRQTPPTDNMPAATVAGMSQTWAP